MLNPYLSTLPAPFDPSNYGLTVFQPDMVLTADQLNKLFGFLLGQEQQTRTRLIGVGVVCGLQAGLGQGRAGGVTVSAGCGVTTEGDLLSIEANTTYTRFAPYDLSAHPVYAPFQVVRGLQLWEIFPESKASPTRPEPDTSPLTQLDLADKVVLLYLESAVKAADECTGVACDNKGDAYNNRLHVLLVRQTDADALIAAEYRELAAAYTRLPVVAMPRVRLDDRGYGPSLQRFQNFLSRAATTFGNELKQAYQLIKDVSGITSPAAWIKLLLSKVNSVSEDARSQYVYDWLKDLHDAYEEFRQATRHWLVLCMPPETAFPKHLLLGELVLAPSLCKPQYRHAFRPSPAVTEEKEARERALAFYQRIGQLIENFEVPATRTTQASLNVAGARAAVFATPALGITPDQYRAAFIDRRAMPFYYKPETRTSWSYALARVCRTPWVASYHAPLAGAPPEVVQPFRFGIETVPFYRIEGFLEAGLVPTLTKLLTLRQEYNLAFDVLALRADANQRLITFGETFDFADLQADFDDLLAQIHCLEKELKTAAPIASLSVVLQLPEAAFAKTLEPYKRILLTMNKQQPPAQCILDKLPLLQNLNAAYHRRGTAFEDALTFGPFLRANPGLEHGAGVPRGGTFVLVYKDNVGNVRGGSPAVVADFYLPYMRPARGNGVQFVLPQPPPGIALPKTVFCLNEEPSLIEVAPPGGSFDDALVTQKGSSFFFNPTVVGTHTLKYQATDSQTVSIDVEVLPLPIPRFRFSAPARAEVGTIAFNNLSSDATEVTWDFGDGSPTETITLSDTINGNTQHVYQLKEDGSGEFNATLTASNGGCKARSEPQTVTFTARPVIRLELKSPVMCMGADNQVAADPRGGEFSSKTLQVSGEGQFTATQEGKHTITYKLEGATASIDVFVLPGSFTIENTRLNPDQRTVHFEANILTPPDGIAYEWTFNNKPITPAAVAKIDKNRSRFSFDAEIAPVFSTNIPVGNGLLVLTMRQGEAALCGPVRGQVQVG
ncbi:PKD domain-containing protein [Hymenobacter cavernae]|uniref:Ig-like domain-containing protein n=1 Tax=Hymenobacter cavernae TaxID=2044852 RepID=A0ABQ1UST0_9BACT|nr:bacterial Ig-like domain-containing protein [Hymenobacter cavernae]GGF24383.1 hypothetical protein GCM10011383_40030 [Hymenobacter cavernae]